jgi:hypothetical protein
MSYTPENSRLKVTKSMEQEISEATSQSEILAIMHRHELSQGLVTADMFDPNVRLEVEQPDQAAFTKVVTINGKDYTASGATEAEMLRQESAIFQNLFEQTSADAPPPDPRGRDERGRFVQDAAAREADIIAKSELELRFKRGEITASDYIEQSGAVKEYLEAQGVPMDTLREIADQKTTSNWEEATRQFREIDEGRIWVGGAENLQKLGNLIIQMGAADAPNVENLRRAAEYLRVNNLLVENPEATQRQQIESAKSQAELDIALGRSSSLWR